MPGAISTACSAEALLAAVPASMRAPVRRLLVNGRFLTRAPTGVDRCAIEMVRALAKLARSEGSPAFLLDLAVPAGAASDDAIRDYLDLPEDSRIHRSSRSGYLWEQLDLAFVRPDATLLSFCNLGPIARKNQFALLHDAQVYDAPGSYRAAFRLIYRFLQPRLARRTRWMGTVSEFSRSRLQEHAIGSGRSIEIVRNGVDHIASLTSDAGTLARLSLEPRGYLLVVGSLAAHKNVEMAVRACEARADRSLPLVVTGSADTRVIAGGRRDESETVRYVGRVSDGELKALYENARLFLFPSLTEGFGLPPLEAMACGCPVLASTGGAIPSVCGEVAAYCDPQDHAAWTAEIERLQSDDEWLARLGRLGREHADAFRWEASARRLLQILDS